MIFNLNNKSTSVSNSDLSKIIEGLNVFMNHFCEDWNIKSIKVVESSTELPAQQPNTIVIFDSIDDNKSSVYNFDQDQNSIGRIFAKTILDSGGTLLYNDDYTITVAQQISELILGVVSNRDMNKWYMDQNASLWWGDVCSPVYGNIFMVESSDGTQIGLCDYILPLYFGPNNTAGPYNKTNTLMGPFGIDEYGYTIKFENYSFVTSFGVSCPQDKIDQIGVYVSELKSRFRNTIL